VNFQEFKNIFSKENYEQLTEALNVGLRRLTFKENFSGQVIDDIEMLPNSTRQIPHKLKVTPKYKIILKQAGVGTITDDVENWGPKFISISNSSIDTVRISILITRG